MVISGASWKRFGAMHEVVNSGIATRLVPLGALLLIKLTVIGGTKG